jgi:hypothetical protein
LYIKSPNSPAEAANTTAETAKMSETASGTAASTAETDPATEETDPEPPLIPQGLERGNTPGNSANGSAAAFRDGWIYCTIPTDTGRLDYEGEKRYDNYIYRIRDDGSEKERLNTDHSHSLNIIGDCIYYVASKSDERGGIFKTDLMTGKQAKIASAEANNLVAVGDWLYYSSYDGEIYRMKTDGSSKKLICKASDYEMDIEGDWLYFTAVSDEDYLPGEITWNFERTLYRIRTDGTGKKEEVAKDLTSFNVIGDFIYYTGKSGGLYKMRTDGSDKEQIISDKKLVSVNVDMDSGFIYYVNLNDGDLGDESNNGFYGKLCRTRLDGSDKQQITDTVTGNICVTGNWIYFVTAADYEGVEPLRVRTDGTGLQYTGDIS